MSTSNPAGLSNTNIELGFQALDHGIENAKDISTPFIPFLFAAHGDTATLIRLVSEGPEQSMSMADQSINSLDRPIDAYALAIDGLITLEGEKTDAVIVEVGQRGLAQAAQFVQRYRRGDEFELLGNPAFVGLIDSRFKNTAATNSSTASDDPLAVVQRAPVLIFIAVASADGKVDKQEVDAFIKMLVGALSTSSEALVEILKRCLKIIPGTLDGMLSGKVDMRADLIALNDAITHLYDGQQGMEIRRFLHQLGRDIASASGGGWFGLGSKISKKEQTALDTIAGCLGLSTS